MAIVAMDRSLGSVAVVAAAMRHAMIAALRLMVVIGAASGFPSFASVSVVAPIHLRTSPPLAGVGRGDQRSGQQDGCQHHPEKREIGSMIAVRHGVPPVSFPAAFDDPDLKKFTGG